MSNSKKLIDHINKFRMMYLAMLFAVCIVIRLYVPFFAIIAFIVAAFGIIFEADIKGICYIGFAYNFRFIMTYRSEDVYLFVCLIAIWLLIMAVNFLKDKKYKEKQLLVPMILVASLVFYIIFPRKIALSDIVNATKLCMVIVSLFFCYVYREKLNLRNILYFFVASVLISSFIAIFREHIPELDRLLRVYITYDGKYRFMGLDRDPNFYAVSVLVPLATLCVFYIRREIKWYYFFPLMLMLTLCGLSTISKSFLLVFVLVALAFLLFEIIKNKKKSIISIALCLVVVMVSYTVNFTQVSLMLDRLNVEETVAGGNSSDSTSSDVGVVAPEVDNSGDLDSENTENSQPASGSESVENSGSVQESQTENSNTGNVLNEFTTGRFEIWMSYFEYFKENPVKFIFGSGLGETTLDRPSHNTIIQGVYGVGIIGVLYIFAILILFFIQEFKKKFTIYELLPFLTFACLALALDFFVSTSMICYLVMGLFVINYKHSNELEDCNLIDWFTRKKKKERKPDEEIISN